MPQRLTPVDILNLRFNRRVSGYAIPEVDDFVRRVAADLEAALTDCAEQKARILALEREMAQYREIEGTLRDALVLAQKAADETRTAARQQADLLLHEAQSRVRDMAIQARRRLEETDQHIERLQQERRRLVRDIRARLTSQLAWLDEEMEPAATTPDAPPSWTGAEPGAPFADRATAAHTPAADNAAPPPHAAGQHEGDAAATPNAAQRTATEMLETR